MNITTRFDLGQDVWRAAPQEPVRLPCRFCRGRSTMRVNAENGDYAYVMCPRCEGRGHVVITSIPQFEVAGNALVGKITVEVVDESVPGFNGSGHDIDRGERYMLDCTGFPSGTVYTNVSLHATEHDAQDAVDEQNAAIRDGHGSWEPDRRAVEVARCFLEHRDVYEHTPEHVAAAEQLIAASEARKEA